VINLDPANDILPYECAIDISELITVQDVMEEFNLGPNGALMYCIEYLEKNLDWLKERIDKINDHYLIFDCPGQVELYTHHLGMKKIISQMQKWDFRLAAVHLVDSHYCADPFKFISILMMSLQTMLKLELPHINILSKMDMIEKFGKLAFGLEFYTDVMDLNYLLDLLNEGVFGNKYVGLNKAICELVEEFGLVHFHPLYIEDKESVYEVIKATDKANGYFYGHIEPKESFMLPQHLVDETTYPDVFDVREQFEEKAQNFVKKKENQESNE